MSKARHPTPYKEGRRQITVPWKRRVLEKLSKNERDGKRPANINQLKALVGAKKGGLDKTFDLDREPQQLTSAYADEISEALGLEPPLIEEDTDDEELLRDIRFLRSMEPVARRALVDFARKTTTGGT